VAQKKDKPPSQQAEAAAEAPANKTWEEHEAEALERQFYLVAPEEMRGLRLEDIRQLHLARLQARPQRRRRQNQVTTIKAWLPDQVEQLPRCEDERLRSWARRLRNAARTNPLLKPASPETIERYLRHLGFS
jgi:hypothetical protein